MIYKNLKVAPWHVWLSIHTVAAVIELWSWLGWIKHGLGVLGNLGPETVTGVRFHAFFHLPGKVL